MYVMLFCQRYICMNGCFVRDTYVCNVVLSEIHMYVMLFCQRYICM